MALQRYPKRKDIRRPWGMVHTPIKTQANKLCKELSKNRPRNRTRDVIMRKDFLNEVAKQNKIKQTDLN